MNHEDQLLTKKQAAKYLNVSVALLSRWIMEHRGPRYVKLSAPTGSRAGLVRYRIEDLRPFIDAHTHGEAA